MSSLSAQEVELNAPLDQPVVGDVGDYQFSPDGRWAAFLVDVELAANGYALYSAPLDGRRPATLLSAPEHEIGSFGVGEHFRIAADSQRVVYRSRAPGSLNELYSVPIDGSAEPVRLDVDENGSVGEFVVAGRGERVVYRAARGLYSAATAGGEVPVRLDDLASGRTVRDFRVSADGSTVVYLEGGDQNFVFELHGVPIDRSREPVELSGPLVAGGTVLFRNDFGGGGGYSGDFELTSDGRWVAYLADQETVGVVEVFAAPTDGSAPARKLNAPILHPRGVDLAQSKRVRPTLTIAGDTGRILYLADRNIHSVPIDGSAEAVPLAEIADLEAIGVYELSADGATIVFQKGAFGVYGLFSARVDGSGAADVLARRQPVSSIRPRISPDGRRALFLGYIETPDIANGLYAVPIGVPGIERLISGALHVLDFELAPDGKSTLLLARTAEDAPIELYLTTGAGVPVLLTPPMVEYGLLRQGLRPRPRFSPDSAHVAYLADQEINGAVELFALPLATPARVVKLNDPLLRGPSNDDVNDFRIAAGGARVVYRIDNAGRLFSVRAGGKPDLVELGLPGVRVDAFELDPAGQRVFFLGSGLRSAPVDGQGDVLRLDDLPENGRAFELRVTPDGSRIVYEYVLDARVGLASVASDGSAAPLVLFDMPADGGYLWHDFTLSADGHWVVFRANAPDPGTHELYSAPVDGSGPARRISGPLVPGGDVGDPDVLRYAPFALGPDSRTVAYLADQDVDGVRELYSVNIDGSGPVVQLNADLAPGQRVKPDFAFAPDGARVVYRADQDTPGVDELYSVRVDGSERRKLNAPLVVGGDVGDAAGDRLHGFRIRPDGAEVVYLADQQANELHELFRVPIDGSAPAVRCSGALPAAGRVAYGFAYTPDGARVVYAADQDTDNVFELYSVPAAGPATSVKLSGPMVAGGDIALPSPSEIQLAFSADGRALAYLADQVSNDVVELFTAPVDGSRPAQKVNGPLVTGGDVLPGFAFDPLGRLVFRADRDTNDVVELYLAPAVATVRTVAGRARPIR